MEYIYGAMLLHSAGQTIDDAGVKKVLDAAGVKADDGRVKALVASLSGIDIEEAMSKAVAAPAAAAAVSSGAAEPAAAEAVEEEEEEAGGFEGLGSLFG